MEKFVYQKVQKKYEDSLSQNDFDEIFNNPSHGELNFSEILQEFTDYYSLIYELETLDYRSNLHQKEVNQIDSMRNQITSDVNQIKEFTINNSNPVGTRSNIINSIRGRIESQTAALEDYLLKLKTKQFFASASGKASKSVEKEIKEIQAEKEKIADMSKQAELYIKEFQEKIENTQFEKIATSEQGAGEKEVSQFFDHQAKNHSNSAEGKSGWLAQRKNNMRNIYVLLFVAIGTYALSFIAALIIPYFNHEITYESSLNVWQSLWDIRAGLLIASLLSILYTSLYFTTKNYSKEKHQEYENKNKATIAKSVGLFSSGSSDPIRESIYRIASQTLFGSYFESKEKEHNDQTTKINLSASSADIAKVAEAS